VVAVDVAGDLLAGLVEGLELLADEDRSNALAGTFDGVVNEPV